ncbi:hypothetical protein ABZ131_20455 [Providencia rettgeri]
MKRRVFSKRICIPLLLAPLIGSEKAIAKNAGTPKPTTQPEAKTLSDNITITSNDNSDIVFSKDQITIKDANGVVRIKIGKY